MEVKLHNLIKLICLVIVIQGCSGGKKTEEKKDENAFSALTDPRRAKVEAICSSCHLFVEPNALDKATWTQSVLPAMGPRMGIFTHKGNNYPNDLGQPNMDGIYPIKPVISPEEWDDILNYYTTYAPEYNAPQVRTVTYKTELPMFVAKAIPSNNVSPVISMVKIDNQGNYFMFDASSNGFAKFNGNGSSGPIAMQKFDNPVSWIEPYKNGYLVAHIGSIMPSDLWQGTITYMEIVGGIITEKETILTQVERPVQVQVGDLDGDKIADIVVNGYGNNKGNFYWLKKQGNSYKKMIIKQIPGAIHTQLIDIDKDGDLDVLTLFAQGTEKLIQFTNDGKGNFTEKELLAFPPVQGSTYFELQDFNKDGILDILYTSGDNADYSVVFKNFHGVYIFMGDNTGNYMQKYFYPMNGAFKAMAADFDGDGDLDIAAISFFADYINQPYEGFLYFEQVGALKFEVKAHPESYKGRWLTMDIGDLEQDGDIDIIMGNFSMGPSIAPNTIREVWTNGPAALLMINSLKSPK